jgi:hypothetical protein
MRSLTLLALPLLALALAAPAAEAQCSSCNRSGGCPTCRTSVRTVPQFQVQTHEVQVPRVKRITEFQTVTQQVPVQKVVTEMQERQVQVPVTREEIVMETRQVHTRVPVSPAVELAAPVMVAAPFVKDAPSRRFSRVEESSHYRRIEESDDGYGRSRRRGGLLRGGLLRGRGY